MFFDSHCHLTSDALAPQLPGVLQRAQVAGVKHILNIGDTIESSRAAISQISIAENFGIEMRASAGIHPQNALEFCFDSTPGVLQELAQNANVVAIGEIGLDYVYDDAHEKFPGAARAFQIRVLQAQLDVALECDLPIVIHNRDADEDLLRVLLEYSRPGNENLRGVFHCFGSPLEVARRVLDLNFHLGFTGIISFKNADAIREVATFCPLEKMLIETDAPYLAPIPHRGKTNEPGFVPLVAGVLAELKGKSIEEIAEITTQNARQLFGF